MRAGILVLLLIAFLSAEVSLSRAQAGPAASEVEQALQDLFSHDRDHVIDDNLRRAYQLGYQRGREDEKSEQSKRPPPNQPPKKSKDK